MLNYNTIYTNKNFDFFKSQEQTYYTDLYKQRSNPQSQTPPVKFFYLDAVHGAGKTNSMTQSTIASCLEHGGLYIIAVPTYDLANQTYQEFITSKQLDPDNIFICFKKENKNSLLKANPNKAKSATEKTINALTLSKTKDYSVIILSHKTLMENTIVRNKIKESNGHLLIDEMPELLIDVHLSVGEHTRKFIDYTFEVQGSYNDLYVLKLKENEHDFDDSIISDEIKRAILNLKKNGIVLVKKVQWNRLIGVPNTISIEETITKKSRLVKISNKNKMSFVSIESPEVFRGFYSTTFFSADFNYDPVIKTWKRFYDVDLTLADEFKSYLRYYDASETTISSRIEIAYGMEDMFSKSSRENIINGKTVYKHLKDSAIDFISGSEKALIVRNKDAEDNGDDSAKLYHKNAVEISLYSHGSNQYTDADSIVVIASANLHPGTINILKSFDWTNEDLSYFYASAVVQAIMRTSLRDPASNKKVKVFVSDYRVVKHLREFFGNDIEVNHSYALKSTKVPGLSRAANYSKNKLDEIQEFFLHVSINKQALQKNFQQDDTNKLEFSIVKNIEDKKSTRHVIDIVDFIKGLKEMSKHYEVNDKKDANLFSNFIFSGDSRLKKDAIGASFAVLDFDDSSLSMKEMTNIFAKEFGDSIFSIGTFSSNRKDPHHYRILILFDKVIPITNLYEFYAHVEYTLKTKYNLLTISGKDRDQTKLYTGIDRSKYNESSFFFFPSFKGCDGRLGWIQPAKTYEKLQKSRLDVMSVIESSEFVKQLRLEQQKKEEHSIKLEQQLIQKREEQQKKKETSLNSINKLRSIVKTKPLNINNKKDKEIFELFNKNNRLFDILMMQVEDLQPGNRSSPACSIAGRGQYLDDYSLKQELYHAIVLRGVDKSTQRSVQKYLRM